MKQTLSPSAIALLGTTILCGIAGAQTATGTADTMQNEAMSSTTMATGMMDKSMMTSDADKQFLMETAQGSVYDQATSELAVQKAQGKDVQKYALRLMDDHTRLNKMLFMQANKRGLTLPLTMTDDNQSKLQKLMDDNAGDDFDRAYLQEAVNINADDVRKANDAIKASTDKEFTSLMETYAKTEQNHLDMASKELAKLPKPAMNNGMMMDPTKTPAMNGTTPGTTTMPTTPDKMDN